VKLVARWGANGALGGQNEHRARPPAPAAKGPFPWLDSSLDLERGLDVIELSMEDLARVLRQPTRVLRRS
jgi:hypothetical protein